jgi:hypothetical protein
VAAAVVELVDPSWALVVVVAEARPSLTVVVEVAVD